MDIQLPLSKHARVPRAQRSWVANEAARFYAEGNSIRDVARLMGRSYGTTYLLLAEAGVELRPRGARGRS